MQTYFLVSLLTTAAAAAAYGAMWALPYVRRRCRPDGGPCTLAQPDAAVGFDLSIAACEQRRHQ